MSFQNPLRLREMADRSKLDRGVLFEEPRLDILRAKVAGDTFRPKNRDKWNKVMALPESWPILRKASVWYFPENYGDGGDPEALLEEFRGDLTAAAGYAYRYAVLGDEAAAAQAVKILSEYSRTPSFETNAGSTLRWFEGWPIFTQVALMVESSKAYTTRVDAAYKAVLNLAMSTLEPIAYTRPNNWATWGLVSEFSYALLANDRPRFDKAVQRWRDLFNDSVVSNFLVNNGGPAQGQLKNNVAHREVYRMGGTTGNGAYGLLYSSFHLDGLVMAAEWARAGGEWLYNHKSPDGSSLKGLWENMAHDKRWGTPAFSGHPAYLSVQWYNTSNTATPGSTYYYSGYYTNRVGASFYVLQELWPRQDALDLMHGGFAYPGYPAGVYPPNPGGMAPGISNGYAIVQDYYGLYGMDLLCTDVPLYG